MLLEELGGSLVHQDRLREAEPLIVYALMLGGPFAPDVVPAFFNQVQEPPLVTQFDPLGWNG